jgi:hypothetical protein
MVETCEVLVLERVHDRFGKRDGARFDRIARKLPAFDQDFGKDSERVFA